MFKLRKLSVKKITAIVLAFIIAIGIVTSLTLNTVSASSYSYNSSAYIGEEKAKSIALSHAGLTESDVTIANLAKYFKEGVMRYDIVFLSSTKKYTYEINATTGNIIVYYIKNKSQSSSDSSNIDFISSDEALSIAMSFAGISQSQVKKSESKLDKDKNTYIYKVEIKTSTGSKYEFKINASSGDIIESEIKK